MRLRPAGRDDAELIWYWANDPTTRANSFDSRPIPWDRHLEWYAAKLTSDDARIWMLEIDGRAVGEIRYDRSPDRLGTISYMVAPEERGRGYGVALLRMSLPLACQELALRSIEGLTFSANQASARAFERAGFGPPDHRIVSGQECLVYRWQCDGQGN